MAGGMHGRGHVCVAGETGTEADGTHPTRMHSCCETSYYRTENGMWSIWFIP